MLLNYQEIFRIFFIMFYSMKYFIFLLEFFVAKIALQAQYLVIGNDSDFVWEKVIAAPSQLKFQHNSRYIAVDIYC